MKQRHWFTLPEAVVIVVCAGLLAVLSIGATAQLSASDQQQKCRDQLKKLGVATMMYGEDNDHFLPFPGLDWHQKQLLGQYLNAWLSGSEPSRNPEFFLCPSDQLGIDQRQDGANKFWVLLPDRRGGWVPISYGINLVLAGVPGNQFFQPHQVTTIAQPNKCMLFVDATARDLPGDPGRIAGRHEDGKANLIMADGHVTTITPSEAPKFNSGLKQSFWLGGPDA